MVKKLVQVFKKNSHLLDTNPLQGGREKRTPTSFSVNISAKLEMSPQNFLFF